MNVKMIASVLAVLLFVLPFAAQVSAHEYKVGDLIIEHPHARATPPNAPVAGGYVTIRNTGSEPDRLVGASASFAARSDIHEMKMQDGVMRMRPLPGGLEIPAGGELVLERGGNHLMFMQPDGQLKEGETRKVTLQFEKAGEVEVEFIVVPIGGHKADEKNGMKHDGHDMKHERHGEKTKHNH